MGGLGAALAAANLLLKGGNSNLNLGDTGPYLGQNNTSILGGEAPLISYPSMTKFGTLSFSGLFQGQGNKDNDPANLMSYKSGIFEMRELFNEIDIVPEGGHRTSNEAGGNHSFSFEPERHSSRMSIFNNPDILNMLSK